MEIESIYFILTANCNLKCKYCFQGTNYHIQPNAMANRKVIDAFVEYCRKSKIHHVEIFGGEPLLYKDLFEYTVINLNEKTPKTSIGIVTNGTLIDKKIMNILETKPISILLSIDGCKERHNMFRGYFDRISKWLPRLVATGRVTIAMQASIISGLCNNIKYMWDVGFKNGIYINIIQNYGWYTLEDISLFEEEYEKAVTAMLHGKGDLNCTKQLYHMLKKTDNTHDCGITAEGLACDWRGILYPCHRAMELGTQFAIGDIYEGVSKQMSRKLRTHIRKSTYCSASAKKYLFSGYCPVTVYQNYSNFNGEWSPEFCKMIEIKAKLVAKYYYEIEKHFEKTSKNLNFNS
ncbi:MAG: radical SAM protein [Deltaproteobacteria bacterium]|nr:radical SAM protein [Deltaproteobacteria bacterium]